MALCPFDISPLCACVITSLHSVTTKTPGPSYIFPAPALKSAISPGSPGSVEDGIRHQDLGAGCAHRTTATLPGLLSWESKEIDVCVLARFERNKLQKPGHD